MRNIKRTFRTRKIGKTETAYSMGYRYDVKLYKNGVYAGVGHFCKSKKEAEAYKKRHK